jgi:ubiquitin C-terminal hydrolase
MYGGGPDIVKDIFFPVYTLSLKKTEIVPAGLINPLNLCYMISVLQCLFSIQPLNYYFFKRYSNYYLDNTQTHKIVKRDHFTC